LVEVHSERRDYPAFEVIQYREGQEPRFLAQDREGSPANLVGEEANEIGTWVEGNPTE
jgi:hypothetical protein